ncbi:MAG: selenocysteine-specific translation elongation factor [SAR202 cluster bacterium]|nr:selenocysteine-specific translation elongation factor [SAR202 cluster bacterium]
MHVIGTAGHVDHGKSTLVKALTGIDPDRLPEEQRREMTIDLGFAWMTLPNGEEISIIDVPGHERFVNNMLAGVGGIDMALLVVAADESVMPQTTEHVAILDLLQVSRCLVAITKADLVDADWLGLVKADAGKALAGTTLAGSPMVAVSAMTGQGLSELVSAIETMLAQTPTKRDLGRPRLPVDRSFTVAGFGTVVTGTLIDGRLKLGQEVELVPSQKTARVRGLQTNKSKLQEAAPGRRVAVNLSGVGHEEVRRGEVLTTPGWLRPTTAMDVRLRATAGLPRPIRHNMAVTVHTGSSEVIAHLRLLDTDAVEPGGSAWAQLKLDAPLAVVKGDYFVVRSGGETLGGGNVVDVHAKRHRRMHTPSIERLAVMERGSDRELLLKSIEAAEPAEFAALVRRANLSPEAARAELSAMATEGAVVAVGQNGTGPGELLYTAAGWDALCGKARQVLGAYHQQFPLRKGAPKEELRSRLGMASQVFASILPMLQAKGVVAEEGATVRLPEHRPQLSNEQERRASEFMRILETHPYAPPTDSAPDEEVLALLAERGDVVRVGDAVVFSAKAYQEMVDKIRQCIAERGQITVADVRDMFDTSRKYALSLMEHLDQQKVTRRVGDARVLR